MKPQTCVGNFRKVYSEVVSEIGIVKISYLYEAKNFFLCLNFSLYTLFFYGISTQVEEDM